MPHAHLKFPDKVYLSGSDCFHLMLDGKEKKQGTGNNIIRIILHFEEEKAALNILNNAQRSPLIHWCCNISLVKGILFAKPYWKYEDRGRQLKVIEHNGVTETIIPSSILNRNIDLNSSGLIELDLLRYPSGKTALVLSWHHIIMDGRGSGVLLEHLNSTTKLDEGTFNSFFPEPEEKTGLFAYIKNMYEVKRFIEGSSKAPIATVAKQQTNSSTAFNIRTLTFSVNETQRIDSRAKESGSRFGANIFLIAACAHVVHQLNLARGTSGTLWLPIPYDGRKRGGVGPVLTNCVAFLFYRLPLAKLTTLQQTVQSISAQMTEQIKADMPKKYNRLLNMMRHIPLDLYRFLTTRSSKGVVASFLYSSAGDDRWDMNALIDSPMKDVLIIPPNIFPPGLTFSFMRYNQALKMNIVYNEAAISDAELNKIESTIRHLLVGVSTANDVHTDVVIAGGGSAGVAAAVAAAQEGCNVILVERSPYLGGKATAAEVGTICGLYKYQKSEGTEYAVSGFAKEFAEQVKKLSHTEPLHNTQGLHYLPYDIEAYKKVCADLLQKYKVSVYLNSEVSAVECTNGAVKKVNIKSQNNEVVINCKTVIDCSGVSCISELANLPLISNATYQAAAQIFTMQGINNITEPVLGMIIMKELQRAVAGGVLPDHFDRVYVVQGSVKNNKASFKIGIPVIVTGQKINAQEVQRVALSMVKVLVDFFVQHVSVFKRASLLSVANEAGIRVEARSTGNYVLTEEDVLSCKKFDTAIAKGLWPIEEWGQDKRVQMRYFAEGDHYEIPAECLRSNQLKNLFFAGRNISATAGAIASARVMGTCLQTGFAAGKLAANYCTNGSEAATIKALRQNQIFA